MSGKYLKEVHRCNLPEFDRDYGHGTAWQCDCGKIYIQTWRDSAYGIPSGYGWRNIETDAWDEIKLEEKPVNYIIINKTYAKKGFFK